MGGSGLKTLRHFVSLLTQHGGEARKSEIYTAFLLVDTDGGDLDEYAKEINVAFKRVFRDPIVRTVHLSADITDFQSFVETKLTKGKHHERLKEAWWYRQDELNKPFTAINLKDSPTRGAGQCPLVSTFLAWNQMRQIELTIDDLLNTLKNRSVQGDNLQNWTLEVSLVAGLAGGTGRGCWHLISSKIREKLRDLNLRPKPVGFFFDSSVFAEDVKRHEQVMKLQVNSITGISELLAWLRNEYERDSDIEPFNFRLPSLEHPDVPSSDLIDTTKLSTTVGGERLLAVSGRAPISAAYLIFGSGKQGKLGEADAYYRSVANALYARLFNATASKTINEAGHLNGLAAATVSVPIAGVQEYVRSYVREFLPSCFSARIDDKQIKSVVDTFLEGLGIPESGIIQPSGDPLASNVPQRVYHKINENTIDAKQQLVQALTDRNYEDAEAVAKELTDWADDNRDRITCFVREVVRDRLWGQQFAPESAGTGGTLRDRFALQPTLDRPRFDRLYAASDPMRCNPVGEAARELLQETAIKLLAAERPEESIDLSSYETKRAIAEGIATSLRGICARIDQRSMPDNSSDAPGTTASPSAELTRARSGFLKTNVNQREKEIIRDSVEPWIVLESNKEIRNCLRSVLDAAVTEIEALEQALAAVVKKLGETAADQQTVTDRWRNNTFWNDRDWKKILDGDTVFDQSVLSAQTLQPVEKPAELKQQFNDLMRESSAGFAAAREMFVKEMRQWIEAKSRSKDPLHDRRLPDLMHDTLERMADQFMIPDEFYKKTFGFFETVRGLMKDWGAKMVERMGAPQDKAKLASVFRNTFGLDYPQSVAGGGAPKQLETDAEIDGLARAACRALAVRLGGRCDPLFQQRFDEGERPTYDTVAVVLPTESYFDDEAAKEIDAAAEQNPQFTASGNFTAVPTFDKLDAGNPYTMFAYATQQFEDWRSDTGMARIASLEYYKTPEVLNWLRACEDRNGASVFLDGDVLFKKYGIPSHRDIYGLGYISPLFVHDKTLKELRWSPWDESKARSKEKRQERRDLLVYALLKPLPAEVATEFASTAKHLGSVLKVAGWDMPLMSWGGAVAEDGVFSWRFRRPAIRLCTEITAKKRRDANHPAFKEGHGHPSIRRCLDELENNEAIASAIAGEASLFMEEVLCNNEYADLFDAERDINVAFRYLGDELRSAKTKQDGPAAEKMRKLIDDLLARVAELETYSPEKLKEHFEKIRRNCELQNRA